MLLSALSLLGPEPLFAARTRIGMLADLGQRWLDSQDAEWHALGQQPVKRIVYLGGGPLEGLAREAALKVLEERTIDLILTDMVMSPMDGIEFTYKVRNAPDSPNPFVPVIMITGHAERSRVMQARDAGVTEFLAKPISAKGLYQRIMNVVTNPRPFIKTKNYFGPDRRRNVNSSYVGPERRTGTKADIMQQPSLMDKARMPG